jgi:acetyl esterase/lipase
LGVKVTLLDFPLAPENKYEKILDVVMNCYLWIQKRSTGEKIILMGDSSGGSIALVLSLTLKEKHLPQPEKLILISPWLDITLTNPQIAMFEKYDKLLDRFSLQESGKLYAGSVDRKDPHLSPLFADITNLAPIHLFMGTHDILLPDARQFKMYADLKGIGV